MTSGPEWRGPERPGSDYPADWDAEPTISDRRLSDAEVAEVGLHTGACCCPDHGHAWYERTTGEDCWRECNHCSLIPERCIVHDQSYTRVCTGCAADEKAAS